MDHQRSSTPTLPRSGSARNLRNERIRVIVRVRPSIPEDLHLDSVDEWCVQIPEHGDRDGKGFAPPEWYSSDAVRVPYTSFVRLRRTAHERRDFRFDAVLPHFTTQEDTYTIVARQRIDEVINGLNASIIMYGQTGSGKSYTSFGPPDDPLLTGISRGGQVLTSHSGLITRTVYEMFAKLNESAVPYTANLSYVQIYKDQIFDLLASLDITGGQSHALMPLQIREDKGGIFLNNVTHLPVYQASDVFSALMFAAKRRAVAATQMNSNSSRSHVLLTLTVERRHTTATKRGVLTFVDLAGSERVSKTMSDGERLSEAKKINQSLSALGNCVVALSMNRAFVPFRDSPLTRLLTESLSGNSKTIIVATIGPSSSNYDESYSTLQFATRCMSLRTNSMPNTTPRHVSKASQGIAYDASITMATLGDFAVMQDDEDEKIACLTSQCPRCGVHLTILPRNTVENFATAMSEQEQPQQQAADAHDSNEDSNSYYSELSVNRVATADGAPKSHPESPKSNAASSPSKHTALVENYKQLIASLQETIRVLERENQVQKEALYCVQEMFKGTVHNSLLRRMLLDVVPDGTMTPGIPFTETEGDTEAYVDDRHGSQFNSFYAADQDGVESTYRRSSCADDAGAHQDGYRMCTKASAPPMYDSELYDSCCKAEPMEIQLPTLLRPDNDAATTPSRPCKTSTQYPPPSADYDDRDWKKVHSKQPQPQPPLAGDVLSSYLDEELPPDTKNSLLLSAGAVTDRTAGSAPGSLFMGSSDLAERPVSKSALLISNEYIRNESLEAAQKARKLLSPSSRAPLPVIIPKFRTAPRANQSVHD